MTTYVLTVDVHDLEPTGPVPATAEVRLWRALPDGSAAQVVSTRQQTLKVGAGPATVTLTAGVAYWAEFTGVRGWETPFLFSGTTDTSIAERWRNGQLDPTGLQPLPAVPTLAAAVAAVQAQMTAILQGAPGAYDTFLEVATQFGLDEATVTALQALVAGKAPLASPALTGTPTAPTVAGSTDSTTKLATTAFVQAAATALGTSVAATTATLWKPSTAYAAGQAVVNPSGFVVTALTGFTSGASYNAANWSDPVASTYTTQAAALLAWTLAQAFQVVSATRDTNEAITTASVVWPDGATGTFTTDTASTVFPGAIDAYHVTHVLGGVTKTVTQTAVTRDAGGAVTAQPALVVA